MTSSLLLGSSAPKKSSTFDWSNPAKLDLNAVVKSCCGDRAFVKARRGGINISLPETEENPAYSRKLGHCDKWLRLMVWLLMGATLWTIDNVQRDTYGHLILAVLGMLSVWGITSLRLNFGTRIKDQIQIVAMKNALTNNELLAEAIIAFWAVRDTRPLFSAKEKLLHRNRGTNAIAGSMLSSLIHAIRVAHNKIQEGDTKPRDGWAARNYYDQALGGAAAKIPVLSDAWNRIMLIPGLVTLFLVFPSFLYAIGFVWLLLSETFPVLNR